MYVECRVSDPHLFHADPDQDPDPGIEIFADPDPGLDFLKKLVYFLKRKKVF